MFPKSQAYEIARQIRGGGGGMMGGNMQMAPAPMMNMNMAPQPMMQQQMPMHNMMMHQQGIMYDDHSGLPWGHDLGDM